MSNEIHNESGRVDAVLDGIILENVPDGLRRESGDSVCSNGMPTNIRDVYEEAATLDNDGVRSLITSGKILKGLCN